MPVIYRPIPTKLNKKPQLSRKGVQVTWWHVTNLSADCMLSRSDPSRRKPDHGCLRISIVEPKESLMPEAESTIQEDIKTLMAGGPSPTTPEPEPEASETP